MSSCDQVVLMCGLGGDFGWCGTACTCIGEKRWISGLRAIVVHDSSYACDDSYAHRP